MKLFGFQLNRGRRESLPTSSVAGPVGAAESKEMSADAAAWVKGEDLEGITLTNAYEQVAWVYRAINVLAEQVANVPFRSSRKKKRPEYSGGMMPVG